MLTVIQEIEQNQGRQRRGGRWESRTLDIDILLWGSMTIRSKQLTIPHYDLTNRDFFLIPLLELDSELLHPASGIPLSQALNTIPQHLRTHPEIVGTLSSTH